MEPTKSINCVASHTASSSLSRRVPFEEKPMKIKFGWLLEMTLFAALAMAFPAFAGGTEHRIVKFDAPGAGTGPGQGTFPSSINDLGVASGNYLDASGTGHGFLRTADGTFTTIDPPGSVYTGAWGINLEGAITGAYIDSSLVAFHGYVRAPDGKYTTFDAPGAGAVPGQFQGTFAYNINLFGEISGFLQKADNAVECWVRAPDGKITTFTTPGAGTGPDQGCDMFTQYALNDVGATAGFTIDANYVTHGWVRARHGNITTFDVPGGGTSAFQGTRPAGINLGGTIPGWLFDEDGVVHGFVRAPDGNVTTFDVKGAGTGPGQGTYIDALNVFGAIVGNYIDGSGVNHGFTRAPDGSIKTFDVPGAAMGPGQGTLGQANNDEGEVTGFYYDANGAAHGFLRY